MTKRQPDPDLIERTYQMLGPGDRAVIEGGGLIEASGHSHGANASTVGGEIASTINTDPASLGIDAGSVNAHGEGTEHTTAAEAWTPNDHWATSAAFFAGIGFIVIALVLGAVFKRVSWAIAAGVTGASLIAVAFYPILLPIALGVAAVTAVAVALRYGWIARVTAKAHAATEQALGKIADVVENAPDHIRKPLKAGVATANDDADNTELERVKKAQGVKKRPRIGDPT